MTKSQYTEEEDFKKADAVYDCIGDKGDERFSYSDMVKPSLQESTVWYTALHVSLTKFGCHGHEATAEVAAELANSEPWS